MIKEKTGHAKITLIAGLGNPGEEYTNTYHNVGMAAFDFLRERQTSNVEKIKSAFGLFEHEKTKGVTWIKPLAYMNESGSAIAKAMAMFKAKAENILILHDDSDLTIGSFKLSYGSGSAGHHGVQSIINHLGTKNFLRIRIGIRPANEIQKTRKKASQMVLQKITQEDQKKIVRVFSDIQDILEKRVLLLKTESDQES